MSFEDIPIRSNATGDVDASWWNTIRTKLIAVWPGAGTPQTFTIADNQSSLTDITGLLFDKDNFIFAVVRYTILRTDGSTPRRESGHLFFTWDDPNSDWVVSRRAEHGDALNMGNDSIDITAAGQAQYKSDSMGGTYSGTLTYRVVEKIAKES